LRTGSVDLSPRRSDAEVLLIPRLQILPLEAIREDEALGEAESGHLCGIVARVLIVIPETQ
jgi:hypothetical protein